MLPIGCSNATTTTDDNVIGHCYPQVVLMQQLQHMLLQSVTVTHRVSNVTAATR